MQTVARVHSVNVGQPQTRQRRLTNGKMASYVTAIHKQPIAGPVFVGLRGLSGDVQADTIHHGGPDKAVHIHFRQHLQWLSMLAGRPVQPGEIGENLTLAAISTEAAEPAEGDFCIGDVLAVGGTVLQVTQPRIPCFKQAEQTQQRDLVERIVTSGRTGLHLRVLTEGVLQAGDSVQLIERPQPAWSLARVHRMIHGTSTPEERATLGTIPELGEELRRRFISAQ